MVERKREEEQKKLDNQEKMNDLKKKKPGNLFKPEAQKEKK
jgi:hypothetical protein